MHDLEKTIQNYLNDDEIIERRDGDDFYLLVSYTSREDFEHIRLIEIIDLIFNMNNTHTYHNIYTSFGIYFIESKDVPFDEAFEKAQFSCFLSHSQDRRVFSYEIYEQEAYDNYMQNCYMEEYTAKAKNMGEYRVYIQPKVDLKTKKIIGGEALLRLQNNGNLLPAAEFMPMLNKNGYVRIMDYYVFKSVVVALKERMNQGKENVRISVNISNSFLRKIIMWKNMPK